MAAHFTSRRMDNSINLYRIRMKKLVKERPILFSTPMVQAIIEGRKTVTRRIIKKQPEVDQQTGGHYLDLFNRVVSWEAYKESMPPFCPYGGIGHILWVRETFCSTYTVGADDKEIILYKANDGDERILDAMGWKWKPSLFMPKYQCRLFLEITSIRVERLQEITREDAAKEGVCFTDDKKPSWVQKHRFPEENFQILWEMINGKHSWAANPWVWVIEFKPINKNQWKQKQETSLHPA